MKVRELLRNMSNLLVEINHPKGRALYKQDELAEGILNAEIHKCCFLSSKNVIIWI